MMISEPLPQADAMFEPHAKLVASVSPLLGLATSTDRTVARSALEGILRQMAGK